MSWDTTYSAINLLAVPAGILMIILPGHRLTRRLVHSGLYPLAFGFIYLASLGSALFLGVSNPDAGMTNIGGVMSLLNHPNRVITGWTHFLVIDLFVGS